jgi:hypothetical protein
VTLSPAQRLILSLEPLQCFLELLRVEVRPIRVNNIEICLHRLHRQKATEASSATPANDQVQP